MVIDFEARSVAIDGRLVSLNVRQFTLPILSTETAIIMGRPSEIEIGQGGE